MRLSTARKRDKALSKVELLRLKAKHRDVEGSDRMKWLQSSASSPF